MWVRAMLLSCAAVVAGTAGDPVGWSVTRTVVSRNDAVYECFPSLTRCRDGRLVLTYRESDGHWAGKFCRLIVRTSDDGGATFSNRNALVEVRQIDGVVQQHNCPKVQQLKDGRLLLLCDVFPRPPGENADNCRVSRVLFWFSSDRGKTWSEPVDSGVRGIMPDEVVELPGGTWLLATQFVNPDTKNLMQCISRSTDSGRTWSEPVVVAHKKGYDFCEASILRMPGGELVCYMRENSNMGRPVYKCISKDGGLTWDGPFATQMEAGHRPVSHLTASGKVLTTYRQQIGGKSPWAKNLFSYLETAESALEPDRQKQCGVVLPLDHDRSARSDSGYTGWVETSPGEFFAVSYIVDDAPTAHIRGYRFLEKDF